MVTKLELYSKTPPQMIPSNELQTILTTLLLANAVAICVSKAYSFQDLLLALNADEEDCPDFFHVLLALLLFGAGRDFLGELCWGQPCFSFFIRRVNHIAERPGQVTGHPFNCLTAVYRL